MKHPIIKFSYILQHKETKKFDNLVFEFWELEAGFAKALIQFGLYKEYDVVAKRLFINIKDRNRKEIYEGDILQWSEGDEVKTGIMEWHTSDARFMMKTMSKIVLRPEMLEVIGNIYENKCDICRGTGSYEVYHHDSENVKGEAACSECEGKGFVIE